MDVPYNMRSMTFPEKGRKINDCDKNSSCIVKIIPETDLPNQLYEYSKNYFYSANLITDFLLDENQNDIGKLDTYFFSIAFLYRHSLELCLKAIGLQLIKGENEQIKFIKETFHNLFEILTVLNNINKNERPNKEMEWLKKYLFDLSGMDKESDSFRYPFHIVHEFDEWNVEKQYSIQVIFDEQTHIDLVQFANKFEAAYEIVDKWYRKDQSEAVEWKELTPTFIETGGYYYAQSVVGYKYNKDVFYSYTKAYLETANYLKWYCKNIKGPKKNICMKKIFLPMCYLYRNSIELSLKQIWFEETEENFQKKCKFMLGKKHSINGLWNKIKPYVTHIFNSEDDLENIKVIEDYCLQLHNFDNDANKFRYPMTKYMKPYFYSNRKFDFFKTGDFLEALSNSLDNIDYDWL